MAWFTFHIQSKNLDDHALDDAALESLLRVYKIGLGETYPKAFLNAYYCTNHIWQIWDPIHLHTSRGKYLNNSVETCYIKILWFMYPIFEWQIYRK